MAERDSERRKQIARWVIRRYLSGRNMLFEAGRIMDLLVKEDPSLEKEGKDGQTLLSRIRAEEAKEAKLGGTKLN